MGSIPYRIVAVDPGYGRLGVAVLEKVDGKEQLIFSNCITTNAGAEGAERLNEIRRAFSEVCETFKPSALALEKLFFSKNKKTALKVAESRGVILSQAAAHHLSIHEYAPVEIKMAVTGYGKSDKRQIQEMVKRILRLEKKIPSDDECDAIAAGLTHLAIHR